MTRVDKILALCADGVRSPVQTTAAEMERTGKRAVGCMLEFCPEEIVYAANMLPVGLWGADIELREVKRYFPAFSFPAGELSGCLQPHGDTIPTGQGNKPPVR